MLVLMAAIGEYEVEKELGEGAYLGREKSGKRVVQGGGCGEGGLEGGNGIVMGDGEGKGRDGSPLFYQEEEGDGEGMRKLFLEMGVEGEEKKDWIGGGGEGGGLRRWALIGAIV